MFEEKDQQEENIKKNLFRWADYVASLANSVFDDKDEEGAYISHIKDGGDPYEHRYYYAAAILGKESELLFY